MENRKIWHVMSRGVRRLPIFTEDNQREDYLGLLSTGIRKYGIEMLSFSLMRNHYHLEPLAERKELGAMMQMVNGKYASSFNRKKDLVGHLFERSFKAYPSRWLGWKDRVSRYIHLNPVRAGIVNIPWEYRWSSMGHYIGRAQNQVPVNTELVLGDFGSAEMAPGNYLDFVHKGIERSSGARGNGFREGGTLQSENMQLNKEEFQPCMKRLAELWGDVAENRTLIGTVAHLLINSRMVTGEILSSLWGIGRRNLYRWKSEAMAKPNYQEILSRAESILEDASQ